LVRVGEHVNGERVWKATFAHLVPNMLSGDECSGAIDRSRERHCWHLTQIVRVDPKDLGEPLHGGSSWRSLSTLDRSNCGQGEIRELSQFFFAVEPTLAPSP